MGYRSQMSDRENSSVWQPLEQRGGAYRVPEEQETQLGAVQGEEAQPQIQQESALPPQEDERGQEAALQGPLHQEGRGHPAGGSRRRQRFQVSVLPGDQTQA